MTRDEAARILDPETSREALLPYAMDCQLKMAVVDEARRIAAGELRRKSDGNAELEQAVRIAARIIQLVGLCRYESREQCRRVHKNVLVCERCIRSWLLSKARKELREHERK